ncbi:hypothetical protein AOQ84DRAFT_360907 [Glonium stellatum]|uniref:CENP-Q, a CENPA-CAD centromere complex subunit-domain-containing protein n=1 Tax=Glonium stellatum TaxID=574774 RepID=A0A8E2F8N5_9PEZI|nr:hypothetical protein AOQ84DRAFT_360907 [Glonium stellatum]
MAPPQSGEKRKRGRPSNASLGLQPPPTKANTSNKQLKRKRGRPSLEDQAIRRRHDEEEPIATSSKSQNERSRTQKRSKQSGPAAPESSKRKKRRAQEAELEESIEEPVPKKFQHLKARTRNIPQNVVASKWAPPSQLVQQQVRELFKAAKRPVILSRRDDRRRLEAETILGAVVRKLEDRLPKMPFPPKTKEVHFDLEKLIERNRMLENQLTPAMHSVDLLKAEIEKEEMQLERDQEVLAKLEENAKAEKTRQKEQVTKTHPLLRLPKNFEIDGDGPDDINLVNPKSTEPLLLDNPDPELAPLLDQLRNHLESMQANHSQIQGIENAMKDAQVALDNMLFKHMSPQQYDSAMKL